MNNSYLLTNATIFDGENEELMEGGHILVADGLIRELGIGKTPSLQSVHVIDCRGLTLMPGLIDAHVHLGAVEVDFGGQSRRLSSSLIAILMTKRLEHFMKMGFTTLRDAGGTDWGFKHAINNGLVMGPDLVLSNRMLSQTGGHGDMRDRGESATQGHDCSTHGMIFRIADGISEVRQAVREQVRLGADFIKVMASGGAASPTDKLHQPQFSVEELKIIVEEAEMGGIYVAAHALPPTAILRAVTAGARTIEHGNLLDEESAKAMLDAGTFLIPTVATYVMAARHPERYSHTPESKQKVSDAADGALKSLEIAHRHGISIGSGSDLLGEEIMWLTREFELKSEVLGNYQTLRSATSVNAKAIKRSDIGVIEVGRRADIIGVKGNPLRNIGLLGNSEAISLVMKAGELQIGNIEVQVK
jgi:imidazolonepropionase-like amidohydrolase